MDILSNFIQNFLTFPSLALSQYCSFGALLLLKIIKVIHSCLKCETFNYIWSKNPISKSISNHIANSTLYSHYLLTTATPELLVSWTIICSVQPRTWQPHLSNMNKLCLLSIESRLCKLGAKRSMPTDTGQYLAYRENDFWVNIEWLYKLVMLINSPCTTAKCTDRQREKHWQNCLILLLWTVRCHWMNPFHLLLCKS